MSELLPCPFCGGRAFIKEFVDNCEKLYLVGCSNSECMGFDTTYGKTTVEEAIKAWNTRADDDKSISLTKIKSLIEYFEEESCENVAYVDAARRLREVTEGKTDE